MPTLEGSITQLPASFGGYVLVRQLAEGGMAEIFLAKRRGVGGFERDVVIKRILPRFSELDDFVAMFLDEAKLASRLSHPNIVQLIDLGEAEGAYFICMEYLAGEDLASLMRAAAKRNARIPTEIVLKILADAARGLDYAHAQSDESGRPLRIVHRDVTPSNLFVTYQGQVKVLDFGIAKAESRITRTTAGVVKGKYLYMAPEQARGESVDARADVFALGVCLYEALTGVRPFDRDNDLAVLNAVLTQDFAPPRAVRPELSEALEALVLQAMAAEPARRFPSAGAMANALEARVAASGLPTGTAALSAYLHTVIPEARILHRTRIPSVNSLLPPDGSADPERARATEPARPAASPRTPAPALVSEDARTALIRSPPRRAPMTPRPATPRPTTPTPATPRVSTPAAAEPELVFGNSVEALFIHALGDRMTPAAIEAAARAGVNLSGKLAAFYPREVYYACVRAVAAELFPNLDKDQRMAAMGRAFMTGFAKTPMGHATTDAIRVGGPRRTLQRLTQSFRASNNYMRAEMVDLGPTEVELSVSQTSGATGYFQTVIECGLEIAGATEIEIERRVDDDTRCVLVIRWKQPA